MRFSVVDALALAVALCACGKSEPMPESQTPSEVFAAPAPAPPARPTPADGGLQAHMRDHFESIRSIERAIVAGELTLAKDQASKLALHQSSPEVQMYSDEFQAVRDAATAIAASESHADMASRAAALASQCGHCHLITSSTTSFEWTEAPTSNQTGAERMQRHRWAMDRLWEGLVGPSEQSWSAGAALLGEAPGSLIKPPARLSAVLINWPLAAERAFRRLGQAEDALAIQEMLECRCNMWARSFAMRAIGLQLFGACRLQREGRGSQAAVDLRLLAANPIQVAA